MANSSEEIVIGTAFTPNVPDAEIKITLEAGRVSCYRFPKLKIDQIVMGISLAVQNAKGHREVPTGGPVLHAIRAPDNSILLAYPAPKGELVLRAAFVNDGIAHEFNPRVEVTLSSGEWALVPQAEEERAET